MKVVHNSIGEIKQPDKTSEENSLYEILMLSISKALLATFMEPLKLLLQEINSTRNSDTNTLLYLVIFIINCGEIG